MPPGSVIDEAQRIPGLSLVVKRHVDRPGAPAGQLLLTGSVRLSRDELGGSDPLVGRVRRLQLHPFAQSEINRTPRDAIAELFHGDPREWRMQPTDQTEMLRRMTRGGFPFLLELANADDRAEPLAAYVNGLFSPFRSRHTAGPQCNRRSLHVVGCREREHAEHRKVRTGERTCRRDRDGTSPSSKPCSSSTGCRHGIRELTSERRAGGACSWATPPSPRARSDSLSSGCRCVLNTARHSRRSCRTSAAASPGGHRPRSICSTGVTRPGTKSTSYWRSAHPADSWPSR